MEDADVLAVMKSIDKKLCIIVGDIVKKRVSSIGEQVRELAKLNMSNSEIASSLGISPTHVSKEKSITKKGKK